MIIFSSHRRNVCAKNEVKMGSQSTSALRRELTGLLTYVALESDVTGLFITLFQFLRIPPTRSWPKLLFGFERRLLHALLCILIALSIQAAMHVHEDICLDREDCLEACKEDYSDRSMTQYVGTPSVTQPCVSVEGVQLGPDNALVRMRWFVYPKTHKSMSNNWLECRKKADDVYLGRLDNCISLRDVICVPSCRDVSDPLVIFPDDRPSCEGQYKQTETAQVINNITDRSLSETLLCVTPEILCLAIEYPQSFRIGMTGLLYQFVSLMVRTLLLCAFVSKSKRGRARRIGSLILFGVTGLSVFIMGFSLLSIVLWLKESVISLIAGYLIQLGVIILVRWFIVGSIPCTRGKQTVCGIRRRALQMRGSMFSNILKLHSSGYNRSSKFEEKESGDEDYGF